MIIKNSFDKESEEERRERTFGVQFDSLKGGTKLDQQFLHVRAEGTV